MTLDIDSQEIAKIHASNAIREKNQAVNFLRLGSRIEAVAGRVETAIRMNTVSLRAKDSVHCTLRVCACGTLGKMGVRHRASDGNTATARHHASGGQFTRAYLFAYGIRMQLTKQIVSVTHGMDSVLGSMDVEKVRSSPKSSSRAAVRTVPVCDTSSCIFASLAFSPVPSLSL